MVGFAAGNRSKTIITGRQGRQPIRTAARLASIRCQALIYDATSFATGNGSTPKHQVYLMSSWDLNNAEVAEIPRVVCGTLAYRY